MINKEILEYVNELIGGNDSHLEELKELVIDFFRDKTQIDLDSFDKSEINSMVHLNDVLFSEGKLSFTDRAMLDYSFNNDDPQESIWIEYNGEYNEELFKNFARLIYDQEVFGDRFVSFVGWILIDPHFEEDFLFENKKEDLRLEINLHGDVFNEKNIRILLIGSKDYSHLISETKKIFCIK